MNFLMGVNISNKEYNFFIISETATLIFLCTAFLEDTLVTWIHIASLLSKTLQ